MYCVCSDSRRLWRMKWKKTAVVGIDERDQGHHQPLDVLDRVARGTTRTRPPGASRAATAKRITSRIPSQNWGMTNPTVESWPVTVEKTRFPRRTDRDGEQRRERQRDQERDERELERRARSAPPTAGPTEPPPSCVPKSPWTAFSSQIANWTGQRLVEPEALALGVDEQPAAPRT